MRNNNFRQHLVRYLIIIILASVALLGCQTKADGTNTNVNKDEQFKQFMSRAHKILGAYESDTSTNAVDKLVQGARALQKDYPTEANGYQLMMMAIEDSQTSDPEKARSLAKEMIDGSAPERFKLWAKGFLYRLDGMGKPVMIKFVAVDGREVDLAKMKGKVVLVDFWSTHCRPCVAELPRVQAALGKYHTQGLEVIGISCDTDKSELEKFVKDKGFAWPQYFDGNQQERNKFAQGFGIDGIPHMFLVDRKGCLRIDNVRATGDFEEKIALLLAEQ